MAEKKSSAPAPPVKPVFSMVVHINVNVDPGTTTPAKVVRFAKGIRDGARKQGLIAVVVESPPAEAINGR